MITYVDIFEDISDSAPFVREIEAAVSRGDDIRLVVNSGGGSIHHAFQRYQALLKAREAGCKITAHIAGACCSSAVILLCSASSATASPGSVFSVHPTTSPDANGSAADLLRITSSMLQFEDRLADVLATRTCQKRKVCHSWIAGSQWFTAEQAVAVGLVDRIEDEPYRQDECDRLIASLANLPVDIRNSLRARVSAALESIEASCRLGRRALNRSTASMCLRDATAEAARLLDVSNVSNDDLRRATDAIDALKRSLATDQNYSFAM